MRSVAPGNERTTQTSFRDPSGFLLRLDDRIIRLVNRAGMENLQAFLNSRSARAYAESGRLVSTCILDTSQTELLRRRPEIREVMEATDFEKAVEHNTIPFQSFPYEWPPEMLHSAAILTIDLAEALLTEGLELKDATPYNILFRGPRPVFVDVLSVERRDLREPIWWAHAQFVRGFLLPLLVNKYFDLPLSSLFFTRRDGMEPEEVCRICGSLRRLLPPFLTLATIPTWLGPKQGHENAAIYHPRPTRNPDQARFVLQSLLKHLRKILNMLTPKSGRSSSWSDYDSITSVSPEYRREKIEFFKTALAEYKPRNLLDIGCNTGEFSIIAAQNSVEVLAVDSDPTVIGTLWRRSFQEGLDILPLAINLAQPSPSMGWLNRECPSFLDRTRGKFDAVAALAVVHHLLVSDRIPLPSILDLLAELTTDLLLIEFVDPHDPAFRRITRGRDQLFTNLNQAVYEKTCRCRFEIVRSQRLSCATRLLYLLRKRDRVEKA